MQLKDAHVVNASVSTSTWLTPETICLNPLGFKFLFPLILESLPFWPSE